MLRRVNKEEFQFEFVFLPLFSGHTKARVALLFLPSVLWKQEREAGWSTRITSGCSKH